MRWITLIIVSLFFIGCQVPENSQNFEVKSFISLDSIMTAQKQQLVGKMLEKSVQIGEDQEVILLEMDTVFFTKEWSFLSDFELNKPGFVGGIEVTKNDSLIKYNKKPGQSFLFDYMTIGFDSNHQIAWIEGAYTDTQAEVIYGSARKFKFLFSNGQMNQYDIQGYQKIILRDTVFFEITGKVM
jgi:hypothetical protein